MELPDIASLRFKNQIDESSRYIYKACGIDYFVIYFLFKNKEIFVLSNIYSHLSDYYHNEFYKHDFSTSLNLFSNNHYVCDHNQGLSEKYNDILKNKYSVNRLFYKLYRTPDFDVVIGAANKAPVKNIHNFYLKSHIDFENFILGFIENTIQIFKSHNPELKSSPYFNSPRVLRKMIQTIENKDLTLREVECLELIAKGLTANETAATLQISKHTVEEHKRSILKKLNAVNITNAVYIAMNQSLLHAEQNKIISNVDIISGFRNIQSTLQIPF